MSEQPTIRIEIYRSLTEAGPFLRALATRTADWTFDIETYDAAAPIGVPGRKEVAVDPFHPDFRVRGVAIAFSKDEGYWIELGGRPPAQTQRGRAELKRLAAAFGSDAGKGAYNGSFDENGLVYTGWVPQVRNRTRDAMLSMIALGDGTHERLTLEHAIRVLLHREYHWDVDKGLMRDLPLEEVARGAVHDACATHELCDLLDEWAIREDPHIRWSKMREAEAAEERDEFL